MKRGNMGISRSTGLILGAAAWLALSAVLTAPAKGDVILGTSSTYAAHLPVWAGGVTPTDAQS